MQPKINWARTNDLGGYEVSTKGDVRFSALAAVMPDGRTIEQWYQCDIKGYAPGGKNIRDGKGKPPLLPYPDGELWLAYKTLWRIWAVNHIDLMGQLRAAAESKQNMLTDMFAHTNISQARALAEILNEW